MLGFWSYYIGNPAKKIRFEKTLRARHFYKGGFYGKENDSKRERKSSKDSGIVRQGMRTRLPVVISEHDSAWQLLIATMLSAQCTDARVNIVTKDLFVKYPSIEAFAKADREELEQDIRSTGFYRNKAKNIIACCQKLLLEFHGEVPSDLESLTSLAGVGRKTANVIRGNIFNEPSIVVDTHVKRISEKTWTDKRRRSGKD